MADILLLGTNGYSGHLTARYLLQHPQRGSFKLALAARSRAKVEALNLKLDDSVSIWEVDVSDERAVEQAVQQVSVVINCIGPYWYTGTAVVRACVRHGKHYVDITGELPWIYEIIQSYDFHATQTRSIIIPACGLDSMPSDIIVYLANKTLKAAHPTGEIEDSVTALDAKGGLAGGTLRTVIAMLEDVPHAVSRLARRPHALSPVSSDTSFPQFRWVYSLPPPLSVVKGGLYLLAGADRAIVERTWGLQQFQTMRSVPTDACDPALTYGPRFRYEEFFVTRGGTISAFLSTLISASTIAALALLPPLRWLARRYAPAPGQGPSESSNLKGYLELTNISTAIVPSSSSTTICVRSVLRGETSPLQLTSVMVAEAALALLSPAELPALARGGGVLTPMSALGDVLLARLEKTGQFSFASEIVDSNAVEESAKRR